MWEPLVRSHNARTKHLEVAAVFANAHTTALPYRARQRVYQFHIGGLPFGPRSGTAAPAALSLVHVALDLVHSPRQIHPSTLLFPAPLRLVVVAKS